MIFTGFAPRQLARISKLATQKASLSPCPKYRKGDPLRLSIWETMEQVFTKDVWFSWILLSGLILRAANRNRSNPLYWILTICWFSFSSAVTKKLLKFKGMKKLPKESDSYVFLDLQRRYKILRKECEISPTALALYEKPTSGIIIKISTSSNFFIKEIRAIMLIFVALVFVYVVNSISEEYKDHPCFQKFVLAVNYIQEHFIEFLIGIWSIWFILPAFISVANK